METIVTIIVISLFALILNAFKVNSDQSSMQRQLEAQHQQIQALKARLAALEPKDEIDQFMDKINKI